MVVNADVLPDFPANRHALEEFILENQVSRVAAFGKIAIFVQTLRKDGMANDIVLNILEREITDGNGGKVFHPFSDGELFDSDVSCHGLPPIHVRP